MVDDWVVYILPVRDCVKNCLLSDRLYWCADRALVSVCDLQVHVLLSYQQSVKYGPIMTTAVRNYSLTLFMENFMCNLVHILPKTRQ